MRQLDGKTEEEESDDDYDTDSEDDVEDEDEGDYEWQMTIFLSVFYTSFFCWKRKMYFQ